MRSYRIHGLLIDSCIWVDVERGTWVPGDIAITIQKEPAYLSPIALAELKYSAEIASHRTIHQEVPSNLTAVSAQILLVTFNAVKHLPQL
jgi:hypothetical protein